MVVALQEHLDQADAGERVLELVGVKYVGDGTSLSVGNALNNQGHWPGTNLLNRGVWYFALVPDEGVGYLEARNDLELVYADDRAAFAEALLDQTRLPDNVFGRGADRQLQERVFDALGIADPMEAGPVDEQLRRMADLDDADEAPALDDDGSDRVAAYVDGYTRDELGTACKRLREDAAEFNLRENQEKHARAEFIADHDEDAAASALQAASDGDGGDD